MISALGSHKKIGIVDRSSGSLTRFDRLLTQLVFALVALILLVGALLRAVQAAAALLFSARLRS